MVGMVGTWVKSLIVIVLLGNLAEFVLPKGDLRRYTGLVVGLILLLAMVSPVWNILHGARPSLIQQQLLGVPSSQGLDRVVQQEEWNQAEAMVLTYPGVTGCKITHTSKHLEVIVKATGKVNKAALHQYISGALQVALGGASPIPATIEIFVTPTRAPGRSTIGRHKEG